MAAGYLDVIKGNEGEIQTVFGTAELAQQRGVDSASTLDELAKARLVQQLAARERNVVVLTGKTDFVSDGGRTFALSHGHELLGRVTGTGCCLGTTISAMVAAYPEDKLIAAIAGLLLFEVAAEIAASSEHVRGPGTFVPVFIDELARCRNMAGSGDMSWVKDFRIEKLL
jgi:thiamine-phosphate diphosphorylase / hydroxyethylthiazole kinase